MVIEIRLKVVRMITNFCWSARISPLSKILLTNLIRPLPYAQIHQKNQLFGKLEDNLKIDQRYCS